MTADLRVRAAVAAFFFGASMFLAPTLPPGASGLLLGATLGALVALFFAVIAAPIAPPSKGSRS